MLAEHGNISVGIDLGRDYSQIAFCSKSDRAPLMVMQSEEEKEENDYLIVHGGELYPDVEKTLDELSERYDLYIVSNCQRGYIESFFSYHGLDRYFKDTECYGNNELEKSENIKLIVERNNIDEAVYVGDIQGDYDSSKKAGVKFIHAAYGFGTIDDDVPAIRKFSELPQVADRVFDEIEKH